MKKLAIKNLGIGISLFLVSCLFLFVTSCGKKAEETITTTTTTTTTTETATTTETSTTSSSTSISVTTTSTVSTTSHATSTATTSSSTTSHATTSTVSTTSHATTTATTSSSTTTSHATTTATTSSSTSTTSLASWHIIDISSVTNKNLNDIYFDPIDASNGWAVGKNGTILHSTDGGVGWNTQESYTNKSLSGCYFLGGPSGWIVGSSGTILHCTLEAGPWISQTSEATYTLTDVYAIAPNLVSVVGRGNSLVTSNEGASWATVEVYVGAYFNSVYFPAADHGWAVGDSGAYRHSNNLGNSWTIVGPPLTSEALLSVNFYDTNNGWTCGSRGTIFRTIDGAAGAAANWEGFSSGVTCELKSIYFVSSLEGWVAGANGTILHTTNGGTIWNAQSSGTTETILGLYFFPGTTLGWACGENGLLIKYY